MSNLLEKASILTTPTAYENGKILSVKPAPSLGSELVTNGGFATDSDWTKGTGWTISGGSANYDGLQAYQLLRQGTANGVIGKTYLVKYDVSNNNGTGGIIAKFGGVNLSSYNSDNGSFEFYVEAISTDYIRFTPQLDFNGSIDNVSVKELIDGDFDFTRNSSATRVNAQGLVEDVQILSSNLVQNGDFSQEGAELVTNGDFSVSTGWQGLNADRVISDGKLNISQASGFGVVYQPETLIVGTYYKCVVEVSNYVDGSFEIGLAGSDYANSSPSINADGTFTFYLQRLSGGSNNVGFIFSGLANLSIDNFSVKEVGQDWTISSGASIGENKLDVDAIAFDFFATQNALTNGLNYKVTLDAEVTSGDILLYTGTQFATISSTGTYTFYTTSDASQIRFRSGGSGAVGSITNITILEITDDTNLPRIDYTDGFGSWLFEPQSTNLITYSEDFSQSYWGKLGNPTITSNYGTSPNGQNNSVRIQGNSSTVIYNTGGFSSTDSRSIYVKATSGSGNIQLLSHTANTDNVFFINENWKRVEVNASAIAASTFYAVDMRGASTDIFDIEIWGAQIEQNSFATSYIPTNGSTVTRLQDAAFGAGSSDLINSTEGVLYAEIAALADDGTNRNISLSKDINNRVNILYRNGSNRIRFIVRINNANLFDTSITLSNITNYNKVALSFKENEFKVYINGVKEAEQLSGSIYPINTLDKLNFYQSGGTLPFYGKTKCVAVFKEALTDEELTCLTTI